MLIQSGGCTYIEHSSGPRNQIDIILLCSWLLLVLLGSKTSSNQRKIVGCQGLFLWLDFSHKVARVELSESWNVDKFHLMDSGGVLWHSGPVMTSAGFCGNSTRIDQDHSDCVSLTRTTWENSSVVKFRTRNWNGQRWTSSMIWLWQKVVKFRERESS